MGSTFARRYAERWRLIGSILCAQLALWSILRLVLYIVFRGDSDGPWRLATILMTGAAFDVAAGLTALIPLIAYVSVFQARLLGRTCVRHALFFTAFLILCFDAFVQFFFFDEYSARYNHLALDYLMYPDEVFGSIFASYNVPLFLAISAVMALGLTWWSARRSPPALGAWGWRDRALGTLVTLGLSVSLWATWIVAPFDVAPSRITNELALNGWVQLVRAYLTSNLDYDAYYVRIAADDARTRVARLVDLPGPTPDPQRLFMPRTRAEGPPLDVVVVMEESLGNGFSARFGGETAEPVTPELDRWSRDGLALTSLIGNGNRTVRGMEGILCSFLPLPGDSIIKRDRSENVASIARILSARGYRTAFFTGGYGFFDNVKTFMTANGFQDFIEQPQYPADAFRTTWGVADEFVFDAMIEQQKQANRHGKHWLGAVITGSNHKPFDVPPGRVSWPKGASARRGAVLYADWALGRYLSRARREGLLDHTVVLVTGDHGARVYGAEEIPVTSYRVPAVFFTPDPRYRGVTIDRLASQVDLAPTLLSLAGVDYTAPFFGRDLLGLPEDGGRAFVNHNRSIGMLTDTALVVLGLHRTRRFYSRSDRTSDVFTEVSGDTPALQELAADTEAAFQTANDLYVERRYRLPD